MKDVFISFSSKETDEATRICELLEQNGFRCFISTRDLIPGEEYAAQLVENIGGAKAVVLLLSNASNASPHVLREVEYAVSKKVPIIVYGLEQVQLTKSMEYYLMTHQWIPNGSQRDQVLVDGLKHLINGEEKKGESYNAVNGITPGAGVETATRATADKKNDGSKKFLLPGIVAAAVLVAVVGGIFLWMGKHNSSAKDQDASKEVVNQKATYEKGDTLSFGSYGNDPIEWRVLQVKEDGTLLLISKNILCLKTFDAAEGGTYNEYNGEEYWSYANHEVEDEELLCLIRGNNDWSESNLRTWLNTDKEVVDYKDQAPTKQAVGNNFYSSEPGFLYGFTDDEKAALVPMTLDSPANTFSKNTVNGRLTTTDLVTLLSSHELKLLEEAGISLFAVPTEYCVQEDKDKYCSAFMSDYKVDSYYWWLRDNTGEEIQKANIVVTEVEEGMDYTQANVGASSYGVRPVICVDIK